MVSLPTLRYLNGDRITDRERELAESSRRPDPLAEDPDLEEEMRKFKERMGISQSVQAKEQAQAEERRLEIEREKDRKNRERDTAPKRSLVREVVTDILEQQRETERNADILRSNLSIANSKNERKKK